MRIVFLSSMALDANISIVKSLKKRHEVYYFTEALHKVYTFMDRSKLIKIINPGKEVKEIQRFKEYLDLSKTYVLKGYRNRDIIRKLFCSYQLYKIINKINPEIIICDIPNPLYFFPTFLYRKKVVMFVHDPFPHSGENILWQNCFKYIGYKYFTKFILFNQIQKDLFIKHYKLHNKKVVSSFLGIYEYITLFNDSIPKASLTSIPKGIRLLFFGRLSLYKGIDTLYNAFKNLPPNYDIKLIIAGKGDLNFTIENLPNLQFINKYIEPNELYNLIYQSDIIICPYKDATQSGVVMTAFALNKPIIATNVGGLPEMITHMKTGYIIPPSNTNALINAILYFYNNPQEISRMSQNIQAIYQHGEKSWDAAIAKMEEIF